MAEFSNLRVGQALNYGNVGDSVWVRVGGKDIRCLAATEINASTVTVTIDQQGIARAWCESSPQLLSSRTTQFVKSDLEQKAISICPTYKLRTDLVNSDLRLNFQVGLRGDFAMFGESTRGKTSCTIAFKPEDIENSRHICSALLYWNTIGLLENDNSEILVNDFPVKGAKIGVSGDTCWSAQANQTYLADITNIVKSPGDYQVSKLITQGATINDGQGVVLLIIYSNKKSTSKKIFVYDGGYSMTGAGESFSKEIPYSLSKISFAVSDIQSFAPVNREFAGKILDDSKAPSQEPILQAKTYNLEQPQSGLAVVTGVFDCLYWFLLVGST